ncbi:low choriolytic enzyme [Lepeophtheirus salmonis]|uniref:low choriolytic enzyme n=1 Tax=Lepeophtheirus salmonis TaxID=72036 RepID=UPI001AE5B3CB|nr:low choriolytic enzyme-like isoform X1 [Lepeophtheirus salmonis]
MKNHLVITLLSSLFFSLCLSDENVSDEGSCRVLVDAHDRAAMYSRNFIGGRSNRWPNGIVPYTIGSSFSSRHRQTIMDSIKHISDRTCVKFVERTNEANYVDIFTGGDGCYANLGYNSRRSRSVLHLQRNGCVHLGVIAHELLHILGFAHEQTRPDRDQYVKISWENIRSGTYSNFWRALGENEAATIPYCGNVGIDQYDNCYAGFRTSTFGMAYDYGSIMHYGLTYFSTNGQNTISLKKSTTARIPNRSGMSDLDVQKTKAAYECQDAVTAQASTTSPEPTASSLAPAPTTTTAKPCVDEFKYCSRYTSYCGKHSYINQHCKKTCFNCVCENKIADERCASLKAYCGYSSIRQFCQKGCGKC